MSQPRSRVRLFLLLSFIALSISACGSTPSATAPAPSAPVPSAPVVATSAPDKAPLKLAFFGFAAANGFAQATWAGVQEAAMEAGVEARFFDPNFDSATQISQIQDAITSGEYKAFVIQANDGNGVVPVVKQAIEAGIAVVGEFTPIGTDYSSIEPQVPGLIYVGTAITKSGDGLGELGIQACKGIDPCKVAYLEGFKSLPLDNARTKAVHDKLKSAPNVQLVASIEGGYTRDSGLKAIQDLLQAHPDVNVIIGSSQAVLGGVRAVKDAGKQEQIKLIGNGSPRQAVDAVRSGELFGIWANMEKDAGKKAAEFAIKAARGEKVPPSFDSISLFPTPMLTIENMPPNFEGQWDT